MESDPPSVKVFPLTTFHPILSKALHKIAASAMQVLVLPISSVPITVSSWIPFAVSTLFHHKQAHPTVTPAPSIHTTTNLTHAQGFNTQYSNQAMSPPTTCPTAEQLSTTTSSLPAIISVTFLHSISSQTPQVTTQHTPLCTMSHKALHAFITFLSPSEQYFLGYYTFPPSMQHFILTFIAIISQWHQMAQYKTQMVPLHGLSTAPNQKP